MLILLIPLCIILFHVIRSYKYRASLSTNKEFFRPASSDSSTNFNYGPRYVLELQNMEINKAQSAAEAQNCKHLSSADHTYIRV